MSTPLPSLITAYRWHRPLMVLVAASLLLLVACVVGLVVDHRVLTGLPIWDKPAKFAVSIAVYSLTLAWLISLMPARRRAASVLGTIIGSMLAGELALIVIQVVRGRTSHFDFQTAFDAGIYQVMGVMIGILWLCNLALVALLLFQRLPDRALDWALRLGMILSATGMGLAFLMTLPTPAQVQSFTRDGTSAVVGAHTVGHADGGPGLPILGWSTVGGDLRIPHFVGLHGLQVMVVAALVLTALSHRSRLFAAQRVRLQLVIVIAAAYGGILAILTWQALRGQSVVHPDAPTAVATAVVVLVAIGSSALILRRASRVRPNAAGFDVASTETG